MSPQDALTIIDQVLAQVNTSREGHAQLLQAVAVLRQAIDTSQVKEPTHGIDRGTASSNRDGLD